ncbi:hypothetical protein SAMN05444172_9214 [Burkholderia sp. GAS332]|nr:hypothetical protein SAMN05444172_9214 [Burkholderia sp. GAS332]
MMRRLRCFGDAVVLKRLGRVIPLRIKDQSIEHCNELHAEDISIRLSHTDPRIRMYSRTVQLRLIAVSACLPAAIRLRCQ